MQSSDKVKIRNIEGRMKESGVSSGSYKDGIGENHLFGKSELKKVRVIFGVDGMTCAGCVRTVENAIRSVPGVVDVKVNLPTESAEVEILLQKGINIAKEIAERVQEKGYRVVPEEIIFLSDLSYSFSPDDVKNALKKSLGVVDVEIIRSTGEIKIKYLPPLTTPEKLKREIQSFGIPIYEEIKISEGREGLSFENEFQDLKRRFIISLPFAIIFFLDMIFGIFKLIPYSDFVMLALATPPAIAGLQKFSKGFIKKIRTLSFDMNFLVSMGIGISYVSSVVETLIPNFFPSHFSFFESAVFISTFMIFGRMIESRVRKNTVYALRKLSTLQPRKTKIIKDGKEMVKNSEDVLPGEEVLLIKGERISHDGFVKFGRVLVDESHITGELIPVEKKEGDRVFAGSLVVDGGGIMEVKIPYDQTALRKMIDVLKESQLRKTEIERIADKVSGFFVPAVLIIAFLFFVVWLIFGDFAFALERMISVLVVACPCALGLATPTAIAVAIGRASEKGIWIKNSSAVEIIPKVKIALFDKTGTITEGKPKVKRILTFGCDEKEILFFAGSAEIMSNHPISKAIVEKAEEAGIYLEKPESFFTVEGKGIIARVRGKKVVVGSEKLMKDVLGEKAFGEKIFSLGEGVFDELSQGGETLVFVSIDGDMKGIIFVDDTIRESAFWCIKELKKRGIEVFIITGDRKSVAERVKKEVSADGFFAELMPDEKVEVIKRLKMRETIKGDMMIKGDRDVDDEAGKKFCKGTWGEVAVMMVGDGINDAPALEVSDIGIAVGTSAEITKLVADVVVRDVKSIPYVLELGRKTLSVIKQNLFWAFIYNITLIPLAGGVLLPIFGIYLKPVFSAIAMSLSSLSVILNSLRLKKVKIE